MQNIYQHIDAIRVRPWMYLGNNNISSLFIYLCWYRWCLFLHSIEENEKPDFDWFNDWIASYYWYFESTSGWSNMILEHSDNEEEALQKFFDLLENYKDDKKFSLGIISNVFECK